MNQTSEASSEHKIEYPCLGTNIVNRCFQINYNHNIGTCFLHCHENKIAFVTAAHNIVGACVGDNIMIKKGGNWVSFAVLKIQIDKLQDVAVFTLDK